MRKGFLLALLVTILAGILTINWPAYSPERFIRQLRLVESNQGEPVLNYPEISWVTTEIHDYWQVEALLQDDDTIAIRIVLYDKRSEEPWLLYRNKFLGPRLPIEWLRLQINLADRIPRETFDRARREPSIIDSLDVSNTYRTAMRLHISGEPFSITATPKETWIASGENGSVVWVRMSADSTESIR